MSINNIDYGVIDVTKITLNPSETALRLKTDRGFTSPEIEECLSLIRQNATAKYSCVRVPVFFGDEGMLDLGFCKFKSKDLTKNLTDCKEAFIFAVTMGVGVDRLLQKLSLTSPSKLFTADGLASSLIESACDEAEKLIKKNLKCTPRFSPGYGDLSLEIQPDILNLLNAQRLLGITLNKSLLMTPTKTITAIMGIENEK